jgi:hypothetical protein
MTMFVTTYLLFDLFLMASIAIVFMKWIISWLVGAWAAFAVCLALQVGCGN